MSQSHKMIATVIRVEGPLVLVEWPNGDRDVYRVTQLVFDPHDPRQCTRAPRRRKVAQVTPSDDGSPRGRARGSGRGVGHGTPS